VFYLLTQAYLAISFSHHQSTILVILIVISLFLCYDVLCFHLHFVLTYDSPLHIHFLTYTSLLETFYLLHSCIPLRRLTSRSPRPSDSVIRIIPFPSILHCYHSLRCHHPRAHLTSRSRPRPRILALAFSPLLAIC
jgi:hypothetical protein